MADSPTSRQWLECLTENNDAVNRPEELLQEGMMSFQPSEEARPDSNGQPLSGKSHKDIPEMSLISTSSFNMFSSDSDGSDAGDVQLPNLSLGETSLEDGLAKTTAETVPSKTCPQIQDIVELTRLIKLEHLYAEDVDGKHCTSYYCPYKECPQVCSSHEQMVGHVKNEHGDSDKALEDDHTDSAFLPLKEASKGPVIEYRCTNSGCNVTFSSYEQLAEHLKDHDSGQLHKCTIHNCTETFHTLSDLREHIYSHRDKRIFTCRICEQSFQFSYQLRKHMELHGEDDEDDQDGETALKRSNSESEDGKPHHLSSDDANKDTDPEDGTLPNQGDGHPFTCLQQDCGKTFPTRRLLTEHSASHDNLLPYKCSTCGKGFKFSFLLNRHRKMHNGLVCSENNCHKSFESAQELKAHMKTHESSNKIRRPRGRPRKKPLPNTELSEGSQPHMSDVETSKVYPKTTSANTGKVKPRPVGRPRKIRPPEVTKSPMEKREKPEKLSKQPDLKPKRPRGRPRLIRTSESDKKPAPSPEAVSAKAATSPSGTALSPASPGAVTPTRCSARSTKGQWRSSGSKTNMGGVGLLTVIKQERTKSRRMSASDGRVDKSDGSPDKELERLSRKRSSSSADEDPETPTVKTPRKEDDINVASEVKDSDGVESGDKIADDEKQGTKNTVKQVREEADVNVKLSDVATTNVIRITTAKPVVTALPRGRPLKSVVKVGHATRETRKTPDEDVTSNANDSEKPPKKVLRGNKQLVASESETSAVSEIGQTDITDGQAKSKKLQRNKLPLMRTMSTRQSRGLTCVIPFCTSYQLNKGRNQTNVHFIPFPQQQAEINRWIKILKLPKDFEVKPSTRICHLHFNKSDLEMTSDGLWQCHAGAAPRIFNAK